MNNMKLGELYEIKDGYYQVPVEVLENEYKCFNEFKIKNNILEKEVTKIQKKALKELAEEISKNAKYEELLEDVRFCLYSIKQESELSTDERTRKEMKEVLMVLNKYE